MGASVRRAVVRAPGKLNLVMRVGGVQPDGYHDVATAYQALYLQEELVAEPAEALTLAFAPGPVDTADLRVDEGNLVLRAARALQRRTGRTDGARIEVMKRVPIAGGMGGGSADAAAALVALDALWGTGLGREDLRDLAAGVGADVPFALLGGTAVGTGRGDVLSPALTTGVFHWVVAVSDEGLSTPDVYATLDLLRVERGETSPRPEVDPAALQALRSGDPFRLASVLRTDLQEAALRLRPDLAEVLALGTGNGALAGVVSGSGPSVAFLAEDLDAALALQIALSAARLTAVRSTGPAPGARLV